MMWNNLTVDVRKKVVILFLVFFFSILAALLTVKLEFLAFFLVLFAVSGIVFVIAIFAQPKVGFYLYLIYCFVIAGLLRNTTNLPLGPIMEILLGLTWLSLLFNHSQYDWSKLKNDHCILVLVWFIINILEVVNPAGASILGWLNEIRFTAFNWLMIAPLAFILFNSKKDLTIFLVVILSLSLLADFYGIKQLIFGVSQAEQKWLDDGADFTHLIFGKLRVFSFYTDAGQFGASQAAMSVIAFVLALGPFKWWKKLLLGIAGGLLFYGMLISGTRGALFALLVGGVFAIFLTKNYKILIFGSLMGLLFIGGLKYTSIGSGIYQINRLRSALDPTDASLNARFINQKKLREALSGLPFGGGVGVSGANGETYNSDKYLSRIPPDSYWVKIWVMYGIVGLVIWFSIIMYILGKCCGIVWNLRDDRLRVKCIALTSSAAGVFFCSYGNEVMNGFPSSVILFMSWSFVFLAPQLDSKPLNDDQLKLA